MAREQQASSLFFPIFFKNKVFASSPNSSASSSSKKPLLAERNQPQSQLAFRAASCGAGDNHFYTCHNFLNRQEGWQFIVKSSRPQSRTKIRNPVALSHRAPIISLKHCAPNPPVQNAAAQTSHKLTSVRQPILQSQKNSAVGQPKASATPVLTSFRSAKLR